MVKRVFDGPPVALILLALIAFSAIPVAAQDSDADCVSAACSVIDLAPRPVRADFAAGIEALHDFWYEEAALRFQRVQREAPDFTLGYWGEALAQHRNPFGFAEPPVEEMRAILAKLAPTAEARAARAASPHERMYLEALEGLIAAEGTPEERHPAYAAAMADLARAYPGDIEALAFHARAILLEVPSFGRSATTRERTASAARRVLDIDPQHHGGLHYFVHAMDAPDSWRNALAEADRYQQLAQGASHAVHMPSHIYIQAGMWDRVVAGNLAAMRTSEQWIRASGATLRDLDRHAVDFLLYAYLQQGREREARELLDRARAERAEFDTGGLRWYDALWSARYALQLGERSDVPMPRSGYQSVGEALGLGLHAADTGDTATARELLAEIQAQVEDDGGVEWRIAEIELQAALDRDAGAVERLRAAIALQSEMPRPNETPDLAKPPEELLGEILLELGDADAAAQAFRDSDARWRNRLSTLLGIARAADAANDQAAARQGYARVLEQLRQAPKEHPSRVEATEYLEASGGVPLETTLKLMPGRAPGTLPEVEKRGSGPVPMVIIPCMSCRWQSFEPFMERNAERYTMYAVTLPGFGGTPLPELPLYGDHPMWFWNAVDAVANLIEGEDLDEVVLMGHSYGTVVATGVIARVPDRVRAFLNVDGNFMSDRAWFVDDPAERPARARQVVEQNLPSLSEAEYWRTFNGSGRDDAARRALYHGMFMATSRDALMQYWRDNTLIDLNELIAEFETPILDLQTVPGNFGGLGSAEAFKADYREQLNRNGAPQSVHTVFLSGTTHYVMDHRPELLDRLTAEFLAGGRPADFDPALGDPEPADVARAWASAVRANLQEGADAATVDRLVALYDEDAVYERPSVGVRLHGHEAIRQHLLESLGSTRDARVDLQASVVAGDDVVLTLAWTLETNDGGDWHPQRRKQSVVLRIVDGKIVAVSDYW